MPAELFPTQLRATGQAPPTAFSRLGAVAGVLALPLIVVDLGLRATLVFAAESSLLGMALTVGFLPETAGRELVN